MQADLLVHGAGFLLVAKTQRHGRPSMTSSPSSARLAFLAALVQDPNVGLGIARPMHAGPRSMYSGGRYVDRNASVRPYIK